MARSYAVDGVQQLDVSFLSSYYPSASRTDGWSKASPSILNHDAIEARRKQNGHAGSIAAII